MRASEANELGERIAARIVGGEGHRAYALLASVLAERTPFRLLGRIGATVGGAPLEPVNDFLQRVAADRTEGGWVIIGSALGNQMERDLEGAFHRCRAAIVDADVWYGADILGERVPGPALTKQFSMARALLEPWRADPNRWVRRALGVSVHYWAKRSRGGVEHLAGAKSLLSLLEPMFTEYDLDAVKGVGWGLKTIGRYYPDLLFDWLSARVVSGQRHRALMLRKALTYLSDEQRLRVAQVVP